MVSAVPDSSHVFRLERTAGQPLQICGKTFEPSGKLTWVTVSLTTCPCAQFLGEAVESRPPVANIEHGVLACECGHRGTPRLEESGYQVSHALIEIVGDTIIASGWDGSSRAVSEEGDAYWLMCDGCGKLHPLPPELHIDWR
jgi:hypothetical protein